MASKPNYDRLPVSESEISYKLLHPGSRDPVYCALSFVLIFSGLTILAIFCYNPIAASFSLSLGMLVSFSLTLSYLYITNKIQKNIKVPNPLFSFIPLSLAQLSLAISYHYSPMNHGPATTLISFAIVPSLWFTKKLHKSKYFFLALIAAGIGIYIYSSVQLWLGYSTIYGSLSVVFIVLALALQNRASPQDTITGVKKISLIGIGNLAVHVLFVGFLMAMSVWPLYDEVQLVLYCTGAGVLIGIGAVFGNLIENCEVAFMAYSTIGMVQVLFEGLVFWIPTYRQMFLPSLPLFLGIEGLIVVSLWQGSEKHD